MQKTKFHKAGHMFAVQNNEIQWKDDPINL